MPQQPQQHRGLIWIKVTFHGLYPRPIPSRHVVKRLKAAGEMDGEGESWCLQISKFESANAAASACGKVRM